MAKTKVAVRPDVCPAGTILEVQDLKVEFRTDSGKVAAVNEVSFKLEAGEIVGAEDMAAGEGRR